MLIKICFILFFIVFFLILLKQKRQFVIYSILFSFHVTILISLILIEEGFYIIEQQKFGYNNNSFYLFYFIAIVSVCFFYSICKKNEIEINNLREDNLYLFHFTSSLFALVLAYCILRNPNYTRFDIFNGPFQMSFVRVESLFYFIFIYSLIKINEYKIKLYVFVVYCLLMLTRGSAFGAFYIASIWLFISFILSGYNLNLKILFSLFFLLLSSFAIKIAKTDLLYVYDRIVLQGHVFWGTVNLIKDQGINPDFSPFFREFNDISSKFYMGNLHFGFGKLMDEISPAFAPKYLEGGVRFAAGYPAILFYHFGYKLGFILHLGILYIYYYFFTTFIEFIQTKKIYFTYFIYLLFITYSDFMVQGEYANFRFKFLIKVFLFLLVILINKLYHFKPKRYRFSFA